MPRQNGLLRLHTTLLARKADLWEALAEELANPHDFTAADAAGDSADAAFEASSEDMSFRLAELDFRELNQIERALARVQEGSYGLCEVASANCQGKIPLTRLNALPCATLCINCERELEKHADWQDRAGKSDWRRVFESEAPMRDQRINFSENSARGAVNAGSCSTPFLT